MANATSTFLQGANAANAASIASGPTSSQPSPAGVGSVQVLGAISKPQVATIAEIAASLNVSENAVSPIVEILSHDGLVETRGDEVFLSTSGERALRYAELAK